MTWWQTFLAAWAPFALLAIGVLAAVVADAWRESRTADRWDQYEAHAEPPQPPPPPPPLPTAVSSAEMRRWARASGLQVSDRGPIPARVREAWLRAQGSPSPVDAVAQGEDAASLPEPAPRERLE